MSLFRNNRTSEPAAEITDGTGTVWKHASCSPDRDGEPVYYSTGEDNWALTPSEIQAHYGRG